MGDYYHDLKEALIASGIPFEDAKWMHLYETESEFNTAYAEDYKEPWVSYVEELSGVAYDKVYLTGVSFQNLKWTIDVPISGGTVNKDNCSYVVLACYDNGEVFNVTTAATVTGSTYISECYVAERHSAGTLTLTASYSGFSVSSSVTVYQEAATPEEMPLTFNIISAGTIVFDRMDEYTIPLTISYSKDSGSTWTTITSTIGGASINVDAGDEVMFKGDNAAYCNIDEGDYCINSFKGSTAKFEVYGNIMSLVDSTGFFTADTLYSANTFTGLFMGCDGIISAENLILPATTLTSSCYYDMFHGCTNLTSAPELPATTLASSCYESMFRGCTSLIQAPELPATTLARSCYGYMFQGCASLTAAPELSATPLTDYCYTYMFSGCTSLTTAPALPVTTLAMGCYRGMFNGCTGLTSAPALPATTLASNCYQNMFNNCTSLTTAPELPATTLSNYCYTSMFQDCTSLTIAPELPATALADNCYSNMFNGCANLTTAPVLPATTLVNACYGAMFFDCTSLNYIKCLATNISASECTTNWVNGVASTGTFVKHPDMSNWPTGNYGIPTNWIVEDDRDTLTKMPLTFEITSGGVVSWLFINNSGNGSAKTLEYKVNNGSWTEITSTTGGTKFNVSSGDTVQFRGDNTTISYSSTTMQYRNEFSGTTARFNVKGNAMSLFDKNNFANKTTFDPGSQYVFFLLFNYCTGLTSAKNLILPATALTESCYRGMFQYCTNLTEAPELPATTLASYCYYNMFYNCASLTTAPELPATTLASNCYKNMFYNCTSIVTPPSMLPATTLANACYSGMFYGCTSLTAAPELPATTLANSGYSAMFQGCTSLTTAPSILPATTLANSCYNRMFGGCTSLTTAPELPATILVERCYYYMFKGCTSLNYIKCLATDVSASNCTTDWVGNVASAGTFVKHPDMPIGRWEPGSHGIPFGWTVENDRDTLTKMPLTFKIISAGTIVWKAQNTAYTTTIEYSTDNGSTWTSITSTTAGTIIPPVSAGDVVQFRGNNATYSSGNTRYNYFSGSTAKFEVEGNMMSLIDSTNFATATTLASSYTFNDLFSYCTGLTSTENLVLPATTLASYCYQYMFDGCTSLTAAPVLPATTLAQRCYRYMFQGCTSLTTAPELPATTLAQGCYQSMFYSCTTLTQAPELTATTIQTSCYNSMFRGCTSLTTAPELPATALAQSCYYSMFQGCTSLTTAPELPATTLADYCYDEMFRGCTSLTTAPELPATTLAESCCGSMFYGCTSLTTAPALPATTLSGDCYNSMFRGCTSLTTAPELPATALANRCYQYMFSGCTLLATAPSLPATTLADYCYDEMFRGCTSLTTAPSLPATTLANYCYYYMFAGCTSLNYIKCLATNISAARCTDYWLSGVASSGTFVKNPNMTGWRTGVNGIPANWTVQDAS